MFKKIIEWFQNQPKLGDYAVFEYTNALGEKNYKIEIYIGFFLGQDNWKELNSTKYSTKEEAQEYLEKFLVLSEQKTIVKRKVVYYRKITSSR